MKRLATSIFNALGLDVHRKGSPAASGLLNPFSTMQDLVPTPSPVIFDVGSHIGLTVKRFRSLFPTALIHSFEPFPTSYDQLCAAIGEDPRIHCHQIALAGETGSAQMSVNLSAQTNSLLASDTRSANYWGPDLFDTNDKIEVRTETLDQFCQNNGITHIDILKLDAQGAEYAILEGGRHLLEQQKADIIYMEMITAPSYIGQRKPHEYLSLLGGWGYEVFDFYNPYRAYGRLIQTDTIMVSSGFLSRYERSAMEA